MVQTLRKVDESRRGAVTELHSAQLQVQELAEKNRLLAATGIQKDVLVRSSPSSQMMKEDPWRRLGR